MMSLPRYEKVVLEELLKPTGIKPRQSLTNRKHFLYILALIGFYDFIYKKCTLFFKVQILLRSCVNTNRTCSKTHLGDLADSYAVL